MRRKVLMFVGSRANYGRLMMVIQELVERGHYIDIIAGSYDLPEYKSLVKLKVDNLMYHDLVPNMVTSTSLVSLATTTYLANKFGYYDMAVVHADRYENLGFAVACSYNNVPLLHTEGGELTGNIDNKVRHAITALADIHCVATVDSYKHIIAHQKYIVGSPAIDYVKSMELEKNKPTKDYILVLYNPADNETVKPLLDAVMVMSNLHKIKWVNPNFDPGYKKTCFMAHSNKNIEFVKGLSPDEYYKLLYNSKMLLGNTSSGIKEGSYLGIPYVLVGDRQQNREVGLNVIKSKMNKTDILFAIENHFKHGYGAFSRGYFGLFGDGTASEKIVNIIEGGVIS